MPPSERNMSAVVPVTERHRGDWAALALKLPLRARARLPPCTAGLLGAAVFAAAFAAAHAFAAAATFAAAALGLPRN
eukprot:3533830-Prymnesium_polylepis.1